jgi:hypothetical protein
MPGMTEEEAFALDEYFTKTTPNLGPNGTGFFSRNKDYMVLLDELSAGYIRSRDDAADKNVNHAFQCIHFNVFDTEPVGGIFQRQTHKPKTKLSSRT